MSLGFWILNLEFGCWILLYNTFYLFQSLSLLSIFCGDFHKRYMLEISILMHLLEFIGYCLGLEHDGTYIVENWWIIFSERTRRYPD